MCKQRSQSTGGGRAFSSKKGQCQVDPKDGERVREEERGREGVKASEIEAAELQGREY